MSVARLLHLNLIDLQTFKETADRPRDAPKKAALPFADLTAIGLTENERKANEVLSANSVSGSVVEHALKGR